MSHFAQLKLKLVTTIKEEVEDRIQLLNHSHCLINNKIIIIRSGKSDSVREQTRPCGCGDV